MVGSSQSNSYPILTTLTMYKNNIIDASMNMVYGQRQHSSWHIAMKVGYMQNHEKYVEPERKQNVSRIYSQLSAQYITGLGKKGTLTCALTKGYHKNLDSQLSIPVVNTEKAAVKMQNHNFRYLKADYTVVNAQIRYDYGIGTSRYAMFGALSGGATFCSESEYEQYLAVKLGITF